MRRIFGLALAVAGAFLVAQSVGTVNGGFIVGAPLTVWGGFLMTKGSNEREEGSTPNEN